MFGIGNVYTSERSNCLLAALIEVSSMAVAVSRGMIAAQSYGNQSNLQLRVVKLV